MTLLQPWHWMALAVMLIIFEVFVPGASLMWLGFAAAEVALIYGFLPGLSWEFQVGIYAFAALTNLAIWQILIRRFPAKSGDTRLNNRLEQYVGREVILLEEIKNGYGKVRLDDTVWRVASEQEAPQYTTVRIVGVRDGILQAEPQVHERKI